MRERMTPSPSIAVVNDIIDWIEDNLKEPLSIQDVADRSGYTRWHFQRVFRQLTGMPLKTYIRRRKLTVIVNQLSRMNMYHGSLSRLADTWGFDSRSTFCRAFRRQFGLTTGDVNNGALPPPPALQEKLEVPHAHASAD